MSAIEAGIVKLSANSVDLLKAFLAPFRSLAVDVD